MYIKEALKKNISCGKNGDSTNKASKAARLAKRDLEKQIAAKIKRDSKSFYKYVNSKSTVRSLVGPLIDGKGVLVNDDKKMGDLYINLHLKEDFGM